MRVVLLSIALSVVLVVIICFILRILQYRNPACDDLEKEVRPPPLGDVDAE